MCCMRLMCPSSNTILSRRICFQCHSLFKSRIRESTARLRLGMFHSGNARPEPNIFVELSTPSVLRVASASVHLAPLMSSGLLY